MHKDYGRTTVGYSRLRYLQIHFDLVDGQILGHVHGHVEEDGAGESRVVRPDHNV